MFDIVRRRSYNTLRVLIESSRILNPQLDDSLICLSGAEIELLRNLTQYLHRQDSFVATYNAGYYLTPDQEAWDDLQAIVADLEEKLMGCTEIEALLEAIEARLTPTVTTQSLQGDAGGTGSDWLTFTAPPEGIVRTVHTIVAFNSQRASDYIWFQIHTGTHDRIIHREADTLYNQRVRCPFSFEIAYPETYLVFFVGAQVNDTLKAIALQSDREV